VLTSPQQEILKHRPTACTSTSHRPLPGTTSSGPRHSGGSAPTRILLPFVCRRFSGPSGPPGLSSSGVWVFASGLGNPHCALAWTGNTRDVQQATWQLTQSTSESESCSFDWYKPNGHATNTPNALPCTPDKPSCALPWHCTPTCDTHQHRAASHVHRSRA
jgi:hypothetical protein